MRCRPLPAFCCQARRFFLLLLCNDKEVVGPWANTRGLNLFTGAVIAVLVMLSVILTASVLFPDKTNETVISGNTGGRVRSGTDCCDRFRRVETAPLDNRRTKGLEPRDVADAAAFATPPGSDVPSE
jgi:hypothetical protein